MEEVELQLLAEGSVVTSWAALTGFTTMLPMSALGMCSSHVVGSPLSFHFLSYGPWEEPEWWLNLGGVNVYVS